MMYDVLGCWLTRGPPMSTKFLTTWVLAAIALSSALVSVAAQEGKVQNLGFVQKLGSSEFKKTPLAQPGLWYIEFMSEDCGACEEFKDDWTKVAEQLQGKAMVGFLGIPLVHPLIVLIPIVLIHDQVGVVDCPKNMQLQEVFEISEYPSFRIIDLTDPGEGTVYEFLYQISAA